MVYVTLCSCVSLTHTSHAMQPLDVSCFKPFKQAFQLLHDVWTLQNKSKRALKEVMAKWVFTAFEKALSEKNIKSGFCTIGIFPFNLQAMDVKMGPSEFYRDVPTSIYGVMGDLHRVGLGAAKTIHSINRTFVSHTDFSEPKEGLVVQVAMEDNFEGDVDEGYESKVEEDYLNQLEAAFTTEQHEELRSPRSHFYIPPVEATEEEDCRWSEEISFNEESTGRSINRFLVLAHENILVHDPLHVGGELQIDYSRSYILISDEYMASLEAKAACKQALIEEARVHKIAAEESKETCKL